MIYSMTKCLFRLDHCKLRSYFICIIFGLVYILMLSACALAYKEEGAIDYRKGEIGKSASKGNDNSKCTKPMRNEQGECVQLVRLLRKNAPQENILQEDKPRKTIFTEDDKVVVRLLSAYIRNYTEGPLSWFNDALEGQIWPRGEIAIVVNAFDFGEGKDKQTSFGFHSSHNDAVSKKGKVVYYSDDVVAGQFLNFNNMPIYGPNSKGINGMGFEIWIVELDITDKLTGELLKTAVAQGRTTYPTLSPANIILDSLGQTVLGSTDTNDTNFLYRVLLEPRTGAMLQRGFLEVGYYVFIGVGSGASANTRQTDINWSELWLDENTARLYRYKEGVGDPKLYTDYNYIVMSIDKDTGYIDLDIENQLYSKFVQALNEDAYNPLITALVINIELSKLMKAFDAYHKEKDPGKKKAKQGTLINKFSNFWNDYVKPSLEKQLNTSVQTNKTDLTREALTDISGRLAEKLASIERNAANCVDAFDWFSVDNMSNSSTQVQTRVQGIKSRIENLIKEGVCCELNNTGTCRPPTTASNGQG